MARRIPAVVCLAVALSLSLSTAMLLRAQAPATPEKPAEEPIDFARARELMQKRRSGEKLTKDEQAYLQRALAARAAGGERKVYGEKSGLVPLTEMSADDKYKGEDGGLYGGGQNTPPEKHRAAALAAAKQIVPRNAAGEPAEDGRIVLLSISMSNATQEFSFFQRVANRDAKKHPLVTIVDGAQGGQAMAEWAPPDARPWDEAERRIKDAGVTNAQVQAAWIKLANKMPQGDLKEHGEKLRADTLAVLQNAKKRFPNLQIAYLSSRIYGGYSGGALNPEPYAYESAFVARRLILDQIDKKEELNYDQDRGDVKAPLIVWGPYLWADGVTPRKEDGLHYTREDLAQDGVHPTMSGRKKVADELLEFFTTDELAKGWFAK